MKFLRPIPILALLCLAVSCGGKDVFNDPSVTGKDGVYKVNDKIISLPAFFRLPPENKSIKFKFEKAGMKPAEISLTYTVDGWRSDNGKTLPAYKAGLAVDFFSGLIYEMPKNEAEAVLNGFTADNATVIKATYSKKDPSSFLKLAVVDGQLNYGREELKHLNLLNGSREVRTAEEPDIDPAANQERAPGPDMNAVISGRPVISAAANGQYDRLLRILAEGGSINETEDATGDNALIKAVRNGDPDAANLLLDNGINPRTVNKSGQTALHVSSDAGFYDLSKRLLDAGLNPNARDGAGNTPLMYAAASPNPYLTDLLIERGARLEDKNKKGETPLAIAALAGNTKTVEGLIKKGADVKTTDNDGNGPVMKAVSGGNGLTLKALLASDSPADEPNKGGVRPLHAAVRSGNTGMALDLLQKGADINAKDHAGNTPLMLAAASGDAPTADAILALAPDVTLRNNEDKTAYAIAGDRGYQRLQRVIGQAMQKLDDMTVHLFERVAANDAAGAEAAVNRGARINAPDMTTGNTPIFTAVANNYKFMTDKLIELGADVNHKNAKGNIPLIVAVTSSDNAMVSDLISAGSRVNEQNNNGDTALIWAVKLKNTEMVRTLLIAGADPNIKNNDGVTAYLIADNEGPVEIRNVLQAAGGRR